jgi:hypothetical protein
MKRRTKTATRARLDRFLLKKLSAVPTETADIGKTIESSALAIIAATLSQRGRKGRPVTDYLREAVLFLALAHLYFSEQGRDVDARIKARNESQMLSQLITLRDAMRLLGYKNRKGLVAAIERTFPPEHAREIRVQKVIAIADLCKILERNELGMRIRAQKAREGKKKHSGSGGN